MEQTNEDIVTKLLSNHEILQRDYVEEMFDGKKTYETNPEYDLSHFLKTNKPEPKYTDKYLFVR
jgi:hypothetical protein